MSENKLCIVTGGAGFIGCALSSWLVERFQRVVALDNLHQQVHTGFGRPERLHPAVELQRGDVADPDMWDRLLQGDPGVDLVIHLAAETGTGQSLTEGSRHAATNVLGTTMMLDALSRHKSMPGKIVLASSRAVYGEGAWADDQGMQFYPGQRSVEQLERQAWDFDGLRSQPSRAAVTLSHPVSIYGATKLAQEQILQAWCHALEVPFTILRFQNVYGPGQSLKNSYTGIVNLFAQWARVGKVLPLYEDGEMLRDFVYIDDVVAAVLACLPVNASGPFDVGTGQAVSLMQVSRWIAERYGAPEPQVTAQFRRGDVRHASCDISDTAARLNWAAGVSPKEGLSRLMEWVDQQTAA